MASIPAVAESRFFADPGTGVRVPVTVKILIPQRRKRSFACRVHLSSIARPTLVFGEDSMQAIALAVRLVNNKLAVRYRQGW